MRALRLVDIGSVRVESVPKPVATQGRVIIRVHACGVCGSDIPRIFDTGSHQLPLTLGHEVSGVVEEVGPDTYQLNVGDRVAIAPLIPCYRCYYCQRGLFSLCEDYGYLGSREDGAYAEFVSVPALNCLVLPDTVSLDAAALMDPAANALHALWKARLEKPGIIVIVGVGTIGLLAVQWAKMSGSTVIATDIHAEKLRLAQAVGADYIVKAGSDVDVAQEILQFTPENLGADAAIDFSGSPSGQRLVLNTIRKQGRGVIHGISHAAYSLSEKEFDSFQRSEKELIGSWNSFSLPFPGEEWIRSIAALENGQLQTEPLIVRRSLDEMPETLQEYHNGSPFSKVLCVLE